MLLGVSWRLVGRDLQEALRGRGGRTGGDKKKESMIEITGQKVFRDRCGPEAQKDAGSVAGFGAPAPPEITKLNY